MQIGYKLIAEAFGPKEIVRQAVEAERAGFDFVEVSDHYHPWLFSQGHSAFAWSMLAAIAERTERIELATGVTCPTIRYHPAIIAQAAATTALLADGRFVLGVGSGERLNEHVVGGGWPSVRVRHEKLREALEVIRLLWEGGFQTYHGEHFTIEDARVWDLPEEAPLIAVAISGPESAGVAVELGDGIFATEAKPELVEAYAEAGGEGPKYVEVPLAYGPDERTAAEQAHDVFRFGQLGWKVMPELPGPINFEAATEWVSVDAVSSAFGCGPDAARHVEVATDFVEAGFDRLALVNAGKDVDGFFEHFANELGPQLRALGS